MALPARAVGLVAAAGLFLGGCSWFQERWPWKKPEVPVTDSHDQRPVSASDANAAGDGETVEDLLARPERPDAESAGRPETPAGRPELPEGGPSAAESPLGAGEPKTYYDLVAPEETAEAPSPEVADSASAADDGQAVPPDPNRGQSLLDSPDTEVVATPGLVVNDQFIPVEEILLMVAPRLRQIPPTASKDEFRVQAAGVLRQAIRQKIQTSVIWPEVDKTLTDQQKALIEQDIEEKLRKLIAEHDGSRRKLEDDLAAQGITLEQLLDFERKQAMQQAYLYARFGPSITVTRRDLMRYYKAHKAETYTTGKTVQMQLIAVPAAKDSPARAEARERIEDAMAELKAGTDFGEVARKYSLIYADSGGVWPPMERDAGFKEKAVVERVFAMDEGEVSDVIATDGGFFIAKALKVTPGKSVSFEEAQEEIEETLRAQRSEKLWMEYYGRVWEKSMVVPQEELIRYGVDKAVEQYWRAGAE